jgi:hypothetical protein
MSNHYHLPHRDSRRELGGWHEVATKLTTLCSVHAERTRIFRRMSCDAAIAAGHLVARRFNVRHRAWRRVFGDHYKAVLVEGGAAHYYQTLVHLIHLNPVRAKVIRPSKGESVLDFP